MTCRGICVFKMTRTLKSVCGNLDIAMALDIASSTPLVLPGPLMLNVGLASTKGAF